MSYTYTPGFLPKYFACTLAEPSAVANDTSKYPTCNDFNQSKYQNPDDMAQLMNLCNIFEPYEDCQRKIIKELQKNPDELALFCSFKNIWENTYEVSEVTNACKNPEKPRTVINNTYHIHPHATFEKYQNH